MKDINMQKMVLVTTIHLFFASSLVKSKSKKKMKIFTHFHRNRECTKYVQQAIKLLGYRSG